MRTLHADLTAAQKAATRIPYRRLYFYLGASNYTFTTADGTNRILKYSGWEEPYAGAFTIVLDNFDKYFTSVDLRGYKVDIGLGYNCTGNVDRYSNLAPMLVLYQKDISYEGHLAIELTCTSVWDRVAHDYVVAAGVRLTGLLSGDFVFGETVTSNGGTATGKLVSVGNDYLVITSVTGDWSGKTSATTAGGSITISAINSNSGGTLVYNKDTAISAIIAAMMYGIVTATVVGTDDADSNLASTPLFSCNTGDSKRSIIYQLMNMTQCSIIYKNDDKMYLGWLDPAASSVYTYEYVADHAFYMHMAESALILPNTAYFMDDLTGFNYIGHAHDATSVAAIGEFKIPLEDASVTSDADCEKRARAWIAQRVAEVNQGQVVVPTNCGQELYDMITITDSRSTKTSKGRAGRIEWEYEANKAVDTMTIYLGGVSQSAGSMRPGTLESDISDLSVITEYSLPDWSDIYVDWSTILPNAIQGYHTDITFSATDNDDIAWTGGGSIGIKFYDGTVQLIDAGTLNLPTTSIYYIYFNLASATPKVLESTTDYKSVMTAYTGLLCLAQKATASGMKAVIIPSYGKTPLITADFIDMTGLKEYTYSDTTKLYSLLSTQVQAGAIKLSSSTVYDTEYDPSSKKRVFVTTPTTPYAVGDLWYSSGIAKRCSTARATGAYQAADWTDITQDDIANGSTYSRVLTTDISAGHILLSSVTQAVGYRTVSDTEKGTWNGKPDDMDEIANGATYAKLLATYIDSGKIKLISGVVASGKWYDNAGVIIDATNGIILYGSATAFRTRATADGTDQCYMDSSGAICAGAGKVKLDSSGIKIYGDGANGFLYFYNESNAYRGALWANGHLLQLSSNESLDLYSGGGYPIVLHSNTIPTSAGGYYLGSSDYYWLGLYATHINLLGTPELNFGGTGNLVTNGWTGSVFRNLVPAWDGDSYDSETIGISGTPYNEGHFYDIYYTVAHDLDTLKDSEAIKNIKSNGDGTLDILSFPEEVRHSGVKKMRARQKQEFLTASKEQIEEGKPKKIREKSPDSINAGAMTGLLIGTMKELISRIEVLETQLKKEG